MDRIDFLEALKDALSGEIPEPEIERHLNYYNQYLQDTGQGKTEEEKLQELGDPRLIAKTIIDTSQIKLDPTHSRAFENNHNAYEQNGNDEEYQNQSTVRWFSLDSLTWYQKVLFVVMAVLVIVVLLGLVVLGINLFFSVIFPILIVVLIINLIISLLNRR